VSDNFSPLFNKLLETGEMQEFDYELKIDNQLKKFESRLILLPDNRVMHLIQDVTLFYQNQDKFIRSEKKFRQILETINEGVWITNEHGITTFVNSFIAKLLGYQKEELIGKHYVEFVDPDYLKVIQQFFNQNKN